MTRWRSLASLVVALTVTGAVRAQSYSLSEPSLAGSYHHVQLSMTLAGTLKMKQDGKEIQLKETASAAHDFVERLLQAEPDSATAKAARLYKDAKVSITVEKDTVQRSLRQERAFLVAERGREQLLTYSPKGPLTREELDVTDHFDTLAVTGLLPGKDVAVGDSWKIGNGAVQALCHLQGLAEHSLVAKLDQVKEDMAIFLVSGSATGIDLGASVKAAVRATCVFDLKRRRLIAIEWTQKDEREPGPVSPALSVEMTIKMTRLPVDPVNELSDVTLVPVPSGQPPREMTDVYFKDHRDRFELQHDRSWQLVGRTDEHVVLRLMDRGEFIAQVSIAPWKKSEAGQHLAPADVKAIVANAPGWEQDKLFKDEEVKLPSGQWGYLVAGEGDLDGVRAVQYFYLVAGPQGDQALLTFTMTPAQTQKLGSRDLEFVRGLMLPGVQAKAAAADGR
jgi:hypothetical protein